MLCIPVAAPDPIPFLASAQNHDGGWGYKSGGGSWTEPTAFALLALAAAGTDAAAYRRGLRWLQAGQRRDGGWAPQPSVDQSTWVTGLAILALLDDGDSSRLHPSIEWLTGQTGQEATFFSRLRRLVLGERQEVGEGTQGWSWFPGTAAWVMPTSIAILALEKAGLHRPDARLAQRVRLGREFLLARVCQDGGWNHGSSRALGYAANSYPETTGVALLALHGSGSPAVTRALAKAEEELAHCRSAQGQSWLRMGLLAHGRRPPLPPPAIVEEGSVLDSAVLALAAAAARGQHRIWGAV